MTKKQMIEYLKDVPDDYSFVLGEYSIISEDLKEEYVMIYDIPINGILYDEENKEIRFICSSSNEKALEELELKRDING